MNLSSQSRKRQRGGTIILMMVMLPLFLIPLVGLAIDGTRLYIVQSKLSAAVDGAALGAGRLLGTNANTTEIAQEFLNVNFPNGYWDCAPVQANIQYTTNLGVQTISIYATTVLPLTFARVMGQSSALMSASGVATRRVTRVEIVLDRSGSMDRTDPSTGNNVFTTMQSGAEWFAAQFTPGYDEVGLVVFSGSAVVAYPESRPWDSSPGGTGGPDKTFATNPQTQTGQIFDQLKAMGVGGGTGTSEALAMAFIELQKTHTRDLAANASDNTLNTIVLFTDGVPDAIPSYLNDPNKNSLKPYNKCGGTADGDKSTPVYRAGCNAGNYDRSKSPCQYDPAINTDPSTQMRGYIVAAGSPHGLGGSGSGWTSSLGAFRLAGYDTLNTLSWWMGNNGANDLSKGAPTNALTNCGYLNQSYSAADLKDLVKIPDVDLYGYSTGGNGYKSSLLYDGTNTWSPNNSINYDYTSPTTADYVAAASWNETDAVGKAIRSQNFMNQIQIFAIGYSGNGGTDIGLLQRLANTPPVTPPPGCTGPNCVLHGSTSYVSTEPIGKVYLVNNTAQLQQAFNSVASSILRLAY